MPQSDGDVWLHCSACRKDIFFRATHWICSVSTCNRARTRLVFCSVACWDSHVATLRHREAWAVEARAPSREEHAHQEERARREERAQQDSGGSRDAPIRFGPQVTAAPAAHPGGPALSNNYEHDDVLIVVSKMKKYIRDRSGMNTSDAVAEALGDHVRGVCDEAIRIATNDGRKTVLDRDVPKPRR